MQEAIAEIESALATLGEPSPWGPDIKASESFLDRVFRRFFEKLKLPNLMQKSGYHLLASFVTADAIDVEVREKLDAIARIAETARPRKG